MSLREKLIRLDCGKPCKCGPECAYFQDCQEDADKNIKVFVEWLRNKAVPRSGDDSEVSERRMLALFELADELEARP